MAGYLAGGTDASPVDADGWLGTGDLGHLDEDGYLYITGRIKNVIIRGGFNVIPEEVEAALASDPTVRDAVVLSVPDNPARRAADRAGGVLQHRRRVRIRYADPAALAELVCAAENFGYDGVWISEPWGVDAAAVLGWCAAHRPASYWSLRRSSRGGWPGTARASPCG